MNVTVLPIVVELFAGKKIVLTEGIQKSERMKIRNSTAFVSGKNMEQRAGVASRNIFISSQLAAHMKIRMQ